MVYGDGSQQRDYLYVGDLIRGIEAALKRELIGTYQLGYGKPTTLNALIATLKNVSGRDFEVRYEPARSGEVHSTWCSIEKATREFGLMRRLILRQGCRQPGSGISKIRISGHGNWFCRLLTDGQACKSNLGCSLFYNERLE